jgi:hypothetical protein
VEIALATWLTVATLAHRLERAESTIRSWRDRYRRFVPEQLDAAGLQVYPLERLEEIKVLAAQRLTPREITAELERRHGDQSEEPTETFEAAVLTRLDRLIELVERIADRLDARAQEGC